MAQIQRSKQKKRTIKEIRRGDIYLVSFDPTVGHEIKKTRPAVVVQNDIGNKYNSIVIVAAITSTISKAAHPIMVVVEPSSANGLGSPSTVRLDQIRSVDKMRLVRRLGKLDASSMEAVNQAILISLGLVDD